MNKQSTDSQYLTCQETEDQTLFILNHPLFSATVSSFGGQLLSFKPTQRDELIWLSDTAIMDTSKPIRGGAPICWPWFGPAPDHFLGEPQHGYARIVKWEIASLVESATEVRLTLTPIFSDKVEQLLQLSLSVEYTFNNSARIAVTTTNNSKNAFNLSLAIHTYLNTTKATKLEIPALQNSQYIDKLTNQLMTQSSPFNVEQAMDRVYLYNSSSLIVRDQKRTIDVQSDNHDSVVIWNPWQQGAKDLADFDDLGYLSMLCVETALTQGYQLQPNHSHTLTQDLSIVEPC